MLLIRLPCRGKAAVAVDGGADRRSLELPANQILLMRDARKTATINTISRDAANMGAW
jgi:hypothetical protein